MKHKKVNILVISPYEGLENRVISLSKKYKNANIKCLTGDLEKGVHHVKKWQDQFDIIISRGGTTSLIQELTNIPVVDIEISILDILRIVKLTEIYPNKFAFVGYPNIINQVQILSEILNKDIDSVIINNKWELEEVLINLKKNNYELIIGDKVTTTLSQNLNINSILIESGDESIDKAIKEAIYLGNMLSKKTNQINEFQNILNSLNTEIVLVDFNGYILFKSSTLTNKINKKFLRILIDKLNLNREETIYESYNNRLFRVQLKKDVNYCIIIIQRLSFNNGAKKLFTLHTVDHNFDTDLSEEYLTSLNNEEINKLQKFISSNMNVCIYGEVGTGKKYISKKIIKEYSDGIYWNVNFNNFNNNEWNYFISSPTSPIYDTNQNFIINNIEEKNIKDIKNLISIIENTSFNNNWFLILDKKLSNKELLIWLNEKTSFNSIFTKKINFSENILSSIITLLISKYNNLHEKNVIGIEPEALEYIKTYNWPGNYKQLSKSVENMIIDTNNSFISKNIVEKSVKRSEQLFLNIDKNTYFDFDNKSLEQIKKLAILHVLKNNNGNKVLTAKQLGISRSTLWRYLN